MYILFCRYPLPKISNYGTWDISAVIPYSDNPVTVKNIKIVNNKTLESTKTELDITELRGTMFSELQSYATIPLPPRSVVLGAAVTKGSCYFITYICKIFKILGGFRHVYIFSSCISCPFPDPVVLTFQP